MSGFTVWTHQHSVGKALIDTQHQHLFHLGAQALRMLESEVVDAQRAHEVLNDIVESMRKCFKDEEKLLAENDCPYRKQHVDEHHAFTERMMHVLMTGRGSALDRKEIHAVIAEWADEHKPKLDLQCKNCGINNHPSPAPSNNLCSLRAAQLNG